MAEIQYRTLQQVNSSRLDLPSGSYIYRLQPLSVPKSNEFSSFDDLAIISSDDTLTLVDPASLSARHAIRDVHKSVTCLTNARLGGSQQVVVTAGRDGRVRFWDFRSGSDNRASLEVSMPNNDALSAVACSSSGDDGGGDAFCVAAGKELESNGPGLAPVTIWDARKPSEVFRQYADSHTDTVTELAFHPRRPNLLLSASTDGLVNVFDVSQEEEDDALRQVFNQSSAVHHASFLLDGAAGARDDFFALGTDETFSTVSLDVDGESEETTSYVAGDIRQQLGCEYVVDVKSVGGRYFAAAGSHQSETGQRAKVDLIPLKWRSDGHWIIDTLDALRLDGAHGDEIVRDFCVDEVTETTFTCGEDGFVRAWRSGQLDSDSDSDSEAGKGQSASKKRRLA